MTEPSESPVELARDLIRCPSVTPEDAGALDVLERALAKGGFHCRRLTFSEDGTPSTTSSLASARGRRTSASPGMPTLFLPAMRAYGPTRPSPGWSRRGRFTGGALPT